MTTLLTVTRDGKRWMTPMIVVMIAIGSADLVFALDSIPAVFGLAKEPFLGFTVNAFALMGLRQLYFLIGGLLNQPAEWAARKTLHLVVRTLRLVRGVLPGSHRPVGIEISMSVIVGELGRLPGVGHKELAAEPADVTRL